MPATLRRGPFCLFAVALTSLQLLERNPEIRAARSRFEAATKRPSQLCAPGEPTADYTNFLPGNPFSRLNASEFVYQGFGVLQELRLPGKLSLASEEAKRKGKSVQQNYRLVVLDVAAWPPEIRIELVRHP